MEKIIRQFLAGKGIEILVGENPLLTFIEETGGFGTLRGCYHRELKFLMIKDPKDEWAWAHEFGHILDDMLKLSIPWKIYGEVINFSDYAAKNAGEIFPELFAMHHFGYLSKEGQDWVHENVWKKMGLP